MLEVNNAAIQEQLGFRVERVTTMGEAGCRVVTQGPDGSDVNVRPVAGVWPWAMWEHIRSLYLLLAKKDAEIAELRALSGKGKRTVLLESGDIAVRSSLEESVPTASGEEAKS